MPEVRDHFPYGVWASNDAAQRWKLVFSNSICAWREKRPNGRYSTVVQLVQQDSKWRIARPNNRDVLKFLEASPTVIDEIIAAGAQDSFMILELQPDTILAHWNGLRWTVNSAGHLATLEQPGSTPATMKDFTLVNTLEGVWGGRMTNGSEINAFTLILRNKTAGMEGEFYLDDGAHNTVQDLVIAGKNISFTVPFADFPMKMTGTAETGSFAMAGDFTSQPANGTWKANWLKMEQDNQGEFVRFGESSSLALESVSLLQDRFQTPFTYDKHARR